ncbi:hypothetical protein DSO57_1018058 [Entomophthora muscae]|uniref:Uncharacterized protein n=1 Tax=Entomophthora muscae TaxID=34485 RepID=A0ACC2RJ23_9FUNG|nr:hypothetical protein DSO57_1018058 [Entomophthora muscae]
MVCSCCDLGPLILPLALLRTQEDSPGYDTVRIDNSCPLETWTQEWDLNPDPEFPRAADPMDQGTACPRLLGTEPLQAEAPAKSQSKNTSAGLTMVVPKEELLELPNEGRESFSVNFMNLKSS